MNRKIVGIVLLGSAVLWGCDSNGDIIDFAEKDPPIVQKTLRIQPTTIYYFDNPQWHQTCQFFDGFDLYDMGEEASQLDVEFFGIDPAGSVPVYRTLAIQSFYDGLDFSDGNPDGIDVNFPGVGEGAWWMKVTAYGKRNANCCPPIPPNHTQAGFPIYEGKWPVTSTGGPEYKEYRMILAFKNCVYY